MSETLQKMISDGERIANLFETLTEGDKKYSPCLYVGIKRQGAGRYG